MFIHHSHSLKATNVNKNHNVSKPKHKKPHAPQPATTLMRHAVAKPKASLKHRVKAVGHLDHTPTATALMTKPSAHTLDSQRLRHAKQVAKSPAISRFGKILPSVPSGASLPMSQPLSIQPRPANKKPLRPPTTTAELLQRALEGATSHQQPRQKHLPARLAKRVAERRITSISIMAASTAVLIGFVLYANLTAIQLQMASSKAGFTANLPGYQPVGYRFAHLNYSPGNVAMRFQSNSDSRTYAISEKLSAWDSQTLRSDFVAGLGQDYQTVETAGHTLYVYGHNNATWVNSGIWYQIKSDGALSVHQLVQLASSM
jgi:hypothetical protein